MPSRSDPENHDEVRHLNQVLGQRIHELQTVLDLARGFNGCLDPEQVAHMLGLTLAGRWAVRKYAVAAWREGRAPVLRQKGMSLTGLRNFSHALAELPEAMRVDDLPAGDLKALCLAQQAALLLPLKAANEIVGVVAVGSRAKDQEFQESDLEFGVSVASQAVVAFENSWHFLETMEKRRMEQELAMAAAIQAKLFPETLPEWAGFDLAAKNRPALQCGGDYYDVLPMTDGRGKGSYLLCVADVSGKGLPAAILMSNLQATLRASLGYRPTLVDLATRTNALLYATTPPDKYVTAILVHVDPATGKCNYVNAGHNGGILLPRGEDARILPPSGPPLGLLPGLPFEEESVELRPGDLLVLFSDGVPEAFDVNEEEWSSERLLESVARWRHLNAFDLIAKILEDIDVFVGAAPPHDDITILVLKRTGEP